MPDKKLTLFRRVPARTVPARTETLSATWCHKDFMEMSDKYRAARDKLRNPMDKCYWCKHPFTNGEMMALACFEKKGNKVLCQSCADDLLKEEVVEEKT